MWKALYFAFFLIANIRAAEDDENISWNILMNKAMWTTSSFVDYLQPRINSVLTTKNISKACTESILLYMDGLKKWQPWAVRMADSTGKVPSGILTGTRTDFGAFDECLQVRAESFKGRFCMLGFKTPLVHPMYLKNLEGRSYVEAYGNPPPWVYETLKEQRGYLKNAIFYFGTCLPSTCSDDDVFNFVSNVSKPWTSKVLVTDCQDDDSTNWNPSALVAVCLLSVLLGVCVAGSVIEFRDQSKRSQPLNDAFYRKVMKCFSIPANSAKVFEKKERRNQLSYFEGVRCILSLWVILSHVVAYPERFKEAKYTSIHLFLTFFGKVLIFLENAFLNMENFSVISGFFLVYTLKKKMDKNGGTFNLLEFIVQKYCRLMPPFLTIYCILFALPITSSGPIWNSFWDFELEKCRNSWLWNMFFIQNFLHIDDLCFTHSWFLGALMQMLVAGVILMLITYRFPKLGVLLGIAMILSCVSVDYWTSVTNELRMFDVTYSTDFDMSRNFISKIYFRPFNHFPSFVCGMVLGWVVLTKRGTELPKFVHVLCWVTSIVFYAVAMYGVWIPTTSYRIVASYYAWRTIAWGLSTCWILHFLFLRQNNLVTRFLSLEVFTPFSRISYCTYIFHPLVLLFREASRRERVYLSVLDKTFDSLAIIVLSFVLAFFGHIFVELPFNSIYELLLAHHSRRKKSS